MIRLEAFKNNEWVLIDYFETLDLAQHYAWRLSRNGIENRIIENGVIVFLHKPER